MSTRFLVWWTVRALGRRVKLVVAILSTGFIATIVVSAALLAAFEASRPVEGRVGVDDWQLLAAPAIEPGEEAAVRRAIDAVQRRASRTLVSRSGSVRLAGTIGELQVSSEAAGPLLGGAPYTVLAGRLPNNAREAGVTETSRALLESTFGTAVGVGSTLRFGTSPPLRVAGIVRDPGSWSAERIVVPGIDAQQFAARTGSSPFAWTLVANGLTQREVSGLLADHAHIQLALRGTEPQIGGLDLVSLAVALMSLLVAALLAGLTFSSSAARTMHDFGLLASVGAPPRRLAAVIPLFAAVVGGVAAADP